MCNSLLFLQAAGSLIFAFCNQTKADYSVHVPALFRCIIKLMNNSDVDVVMISWEALNAVTKVCGDTDFKWNLCIFEVEATTV